MHNKHLVNTIDLSKLSLSNTTQSVENMELTISYSFTIAGFTLSYARLCKPHNGYDIMSSIYLICNASEFLKFSDVYLKRTIEIWNSTKINHLFLLYCSFFTCRYSILLAKDPALYSSLIVCVTLVAFLNTKYSIPKTRYDCVKYLVVLLNTKDPALHSYCVCDVSNLYEHQIFYPKTRYDCFKYLVV